ncbi:hypothetical protein MJT46_017466 [Ovis ammon polii x Ovis aries]|nr:hypothetical protein MJT46_017466 [Ovis ammon polii x Ovis aries]
MAVSWIVLSLWPLTVFVGRIGGQFVFFEPITLRMCQDLPYNTAFTPNLLNHYAQQTAVLADCYSSFLFLPVCMQYIFPSSPFQSICVLRFPDCGEPSPRLVALNLAGAPTDPADPTDPPTVERDCGFWCPREWKIDPDLGCSFLPMYFRRGELSFARYFIGLISGICLSATLFTFFTFLIDGIRFRYPERPIIMYAACYMTVSLIFFLGFLLEDRVACRASSPAQYKASTVTQGSQNKAGIMLSMILYFFDYGWQHWWVILTITWFLAAVPKWGSEAIEKKALLFPAEAWGNTGTLTVILSAMNRIEGDGISGVCFVGLYDVDALRYFVLAPLCLCVVVGVSLLLAGIISLNRVRVEIPFEKENQYKLVEFMIWIGQASRGIWETTWIQELCREYHIPCPFRISLWFHVLFLSEYLLQNSSVCFPRCWSSLAVLSGRKRHPPAANSQLVNTRKPLQPIKISQLVNTRKLLQPISPCQLCLCSKPVNTAVNLGSGLLLHSTALDVAGALARARNKTPSCFYIAHLDLRLLASRNVTQSISVGSATQFEGLCYHSPSKLIKHISVHLFISSLMTSAFYSFQHRRHMFCEVYTQVFLC